MIIPTIEKDSAFIANGKPEKPSRSCPGDLADALLATVITVTRAGIGLLPVTIRGFGDTLQLEVTGAPKQVNCTLPVNPPLGDRVKS
jgi:hypothetical protein